MRFDGKGAPASTPAACATPGDNHEKSHDERRETAERHGNLRSSCGSRGADCGERFLSRPPGWVRLQSDTSLSHTGTSTTPAGSISTRTRSPGRAWSMRVVTDSSSTPSSRRTWSQTTAPSRSAPTTTRVVAGDDAHGLRARHDRAVAVRDDVPYPEESGDPVVRGLRPELVRRRHLCDPALAQDRHPVPDRERFADVVRHVDDSE